jgi:hypothetical protein
MSSLSANVLADTSSEPSENFDHAEHTPEPIHEEIDSEAPRMSKRPRTVKSFGDDFTIYLVDNTPKISVEAFASPDADDWKEAVCSEINSILSNETWSWLIDHMVVKLWVVSGCLKRSLGQMVLLTNTRQFLWPRVIPKRKTKISLILIHLLLD